MIRQKITSGSPSQKNLHQHGGDQAQTQNDAISTLQGKNNRGIVRIQTGLKKVDSTQSLIATTPTSITNSSKKHQEGFDSLKNNQQSNGEIKVGAQLMSFSSPLTQQQQQSQQKGMLNLQNGMKILQNGILNHIDLNQISNQKNKNNQFKLSGISLVGGNTSSSSFMGGMAGESLRQQNRDTTDRSAKSNGMLGYSVQIINKQFTTLNDYVKAGDWKRITKLELTHNKLQQFPNEIWDLTELRTLKLDSNCIKLLPDWLFERLTELKDFSIANNLIKCVPQNISQAKHLSHLDLSLNHIEELPTEIFDLQCLTTLSVISNDFETLPCSFIKLENTLKHFSIDWFRYANPPMNIQQGESAIRILIEAIKKDLISNYIPFDITKTIQQSDKLQNINKQTIPYLSISSLSATGQESSTNLTSLLDHPSHINIIANNFSSNSYHTNSLTPNNIPPNNNNTTNLTPFNFTNNINNFQTTNQNTINVDEGYFRNKQFSFVKFISTFSKLFDLKRVVTAESGGSLAHQAVYNEDIGALVNLLSYDEQYFLNCIDKHLHSPLSLAIREEQYYSAKILIYRGANVNIGSGVTGSSCLLIAIAKLQFYLIKDLVERGAQLNHADKENNNCIHSLFKIFDNNPKEATKIADYLLSKGANPNKLNNARWSPLHIAARKGNINAIKYALNFNKLNKQENSQKRDNSQNKIEDNFYDNCEKKSEGNQLINFLQNLGQHQNVTENNKSNLHIIVNECKTNMVNSNNISKKGVDGNNNQPILFKLYQRGGEEKMNILHIASQNCFTDIVETLILEEDYNFTKRNRFDRNAYSLSQRHSTISKLLKRAEVRILDCFIHQDLLKIIENQMYDCCDDDLAQINPYQKSKAYNFYDQINSNNRLSALNSSFNMQTSQISSNNQNIATEERSSYYKGESNPLSTNKMNSSKNNTSTGIHSTIAQSKFSFLNQNNMNQPYSLFQKNTPYLLGNASDSSNFGRNLLKNFNSEQPYFNIQNIEKQQNKSPQKSDLNRTLQNKNIECEIPLELEQIQRADSFHSFQDANKTGDNINTIGDNDNQQHYLGSFLIQNSLQAFRKSREDFQKIQNRMYPNCPLPQSQIKGFQRNVNILESFTSSNINSESALNASDEMNGVNLISQLKQNVLVSQKNQTKKIKELQNYSSQNISQNELSKQQLLYQQQQQQLKNQQQNSRKGLECGEQDSSFDQIGEEIGVKQSQILSWQKQYPKLIQNKVEEERKSSINNLSLYQKYSSDVQQEKEEIGINIQKNNPIPFQYIQQRKEKLQSQNVKQKKQGKDIDMQKMKEILESSLNESNSSDEQNTDELQENIEESLNESYSCRIMPYSANNLKNIHSALRQSLTATDTTDQSLSDARFSLIPTQPIKIRKNYNDSLQNVFKSNIYGMYSKMYEQSSDRMQQMDSVIEGSITLNAQSLNKYCYKLKIQQKVDQLLEMLKYSEVKLKNEDLILSRRIDSLNRIKEIETYLKSILVELTQNNTYTVGNEIEITNTKEHITNAITLYNEVITSIYFYFFHQNKHFNYQIQDSQHQDQHFSNQKNEFKNKPQFQLYHSISTANHSLNQIKLEKDYIHIQRQAVQQKLSDFKTLNIIFQQLFPQNHIIAFQQQLKPLSLHSNQSKNQNQNGNMSQNENSYNLNGRISQLSNKRQNQNTQIQQQNIPRITVNNQYDKEQMAINPLLYFETVQRIQLHLANPSSRTHILNETQLMKTLPTEEEYDIHQIEQPSIKFSQYAIQKPKGSALKNRTSIVNKLNI